MSRLEALDGVRHNIEVKLARDDKAVAVALFDIDKTLARLESIHTPAVYAMFPTAEQKLKAALQVGGEDIRAARQLLVNEHGVIPKDLLADIYYLGFQLGNSFREWDRMHGIVVEERFDWIDLKVYRQQRIPYIDEVNNDHARAGEYLQRYGQVAVQILERTQRDHPEELEAAKIKPIFHLAKLYQRLGIPMGGMTANQGDFARAAVKHLGLSEFFIDLATDETMEGGGKELAIQELIRGMESLGIPIPQDRLILVGDSLRGDIGVARKLSGDLKAKAGVLVLADTNELKTLQESLVGDPELAAIVQAIKVEGLVVDKVRTNRAGAPILGSRYRQEFLHPLKPKLE